MGPRRAWFEVVDEPPSLSVGEEDEKMEASTSPSTSDSSSHGGKEGEEEGRDDGATAPVEGPTDQGEGEESVVEEEGSDGVDLMRKWKHRVNR